MNKTEFKVGDIVKFGYAEGLVSYVGLDQFGEIVKVKFGENLDNFSIYDFSRNGKIDKYAPEGFPRLTLVSRPEKWVEKEVYHPVGRGMGRYVDTLFFNTKEEALSAYEHTIGYSVSKIYVKEGE